MRRRKALDSMLDSQFAELLLSRLRAAVLAQGGSDDDLLVIAMDQGASYIRKMAACLAGAASPPVLRYEQFRIEELALSYRSYTRLKRAGKDTIGEVTRMTERELLALPGFGKRSLEDLRLALEEFNLQLDPG